MKKYRVEIFVSGHWEGIVEADSEEEAIECACENAQSDGYFEYETESCKRVEDDECDL